MKQLMVIILIVFSVVCNVAGNQKYQHGVMPVFNPPIIAEPENCVQFEKELDFKKPYMRLSSCKRKGGIGNPLTITYYILGKHGKQMEKDLVDKFNINPLKRDNMYVWSSEKILDNYYSDERVLVILVGMTDWGAKTRDGWDSPDMQFLIEFSKHPYPW